VGGRATREHGRDEGQQRGTDSDARGADAERREVGAERSRRAGRSEQDGGA
jgi:hypothetical protein